MKTKISTFLTVPIFMGLLFSSVAPGHCVSDLPQKIEQDSIGPGTWANCYGQGTPQRMTYNDTGPTGWRVNAFTCGSTNARCDTSIIWENPAKVYTATISALPGYSISGTMHFYLVNYESVPNCVLNDQNIPVCQEDPLGPPWNEYQLAYDDVDMTNIGPCYAT